MASFLDFPSAIPYQNGDKVMTESYTYTYDGASATWVITEEPVNVDVNEKNILTSATAASDAITIEATNAAGGIQLTAGSGGFAATITSGDLDLNTTVGGDINITSIDDVLIGFGTGDSFKIRDSSLNELFTATSSQLDAKIPLITNTTLNIDGGLNAIAGYQKINNTAGTQDGGTFAKTTVSAIPDNTYDLDITIDGGALRQTATALLNTDTWENVCAKIQTALRVLTGSTETIEIVGGKIRVASATVGAGSIVLVAAGTLGSGGGDLITAIDAIGAAGDYAPVVEAAVQGTGDSPILSIKDEDDYVLSFQKMDAGEANIINDEGQINIKPSGDVDDYLVISTATNVVQIGVDDDLDLLQLTSGKLLINGNIDLVSISNEIMMGANIIFGLPNATSIAVGWDTGLSLTTGAGTTLIGSYAGNNLIDTTSNTFIGYQAGCNCIANYNIGIGVNALNGAAAAFTGDYNIGIGYQTGFALTIGNANQIIGHQAGKSLAAGAENVLIGCRAGYNLADDHGNAFIGHESGYNATTDDNIGIGRYAVRGTNGAFIGGLNIGIGHSTGIVLTTGDNNILLGYQAGMSLTSGDNNVLIGYQAGMNFNVRDNNVLLGYQAGMGLTTGDGNVFIGYQAGSAEAVNSDKLYIANTNTTTPLIYGDFVIPALTINGSLTVDTIIGVATSGYQELSNSTGDQDGGTFTGTTVPGLNNTYDLDITIDGIAYQVPTVIGVGDSWTVITASIQAALRVLSSATEEVAIVNNQIRVTSADTTGSISTVLIAAGTLGSGGGDLITAIDGLGAAGDYIPIISDAVAGTGDSNILKIQDVTNNTFTIQKMDIGQTEIKAAGSIFIKPSGDIDDYLVLSTTANISYIGIDSDTNLLALKDDKLEISGAIVSKDIAAPTLIAGVSGYQEIRNTGTQDGGTFTGATVPGIASATYDLDITINGGALRQTATALLNTDDWDGITAKIQAALRALTTATEVVAIVGGKIRVTSADTVGVPSTVLIAAGTAGSGGGDFLAYIDAFGGGAIYTPVIETAVIGTAEAGIYSNGGELYAIDTASNSTILSPHDSKTGDWIYLSKNLKTGITKKVNMENLVKIVEELSGKKLMEVF